MVNMDWEIDSKDRAILYHLDRDSRQPISKISKKVKLNREVVRYRIDRMLKDGIIQKFLTFVSVPRLGYMPTMFFMRFQNTSAKDEEEIAKYLNEKKNVVWLGSTHGRFDMGFVMCARSIKEISDFIADFRDKYRRFISDFSMTNIVLAWRFPRKYLVEETDRDIRKAESLGKIHYKDTHLDEVDKAIIIALGEDGRMKAVDVARKAGISADAVADRIKKLKRTGTIENSTIVLDNMALKRRFFKTFITFHNIKKIEKRFLNYCDEHPNAVQIKRVLGPWEYEVDLELQDEMELRATEADFKEKFKDAVRSTSFVSVHKIHKFDMGGFLKKDEED